MIKVLIADDHEVFRIGLKLILTKDPDISVIDEANNGAEALNKISNTDYDILIVDISMPGLSGLDVLKELKTIKPDLPVLVLSFYPEDQYAVRVLKKGADGYITKEAAPDVLVSAVKQICHGHKFITPSIAEKLALYVESESDKKDHELLSDREYLVFKRLAAGVPNKIIASEMGLSEKTISTYKMRILEKMKMDTNAQLTHYALKENLL